MTEVLRDTYGWTIDRRTADRLHCLWNIIRQKNNLRELYSIYRVGKKQDKGECRRVIKILRQKLFL